ncbi:MAG: hypothetical protein E7B29_13165, partial [Mixta calida]|nr:hypothetical protein [Mixta calida]
DKAIKLWPMLEAFLQQGIFERSSYDDACLHLQALFG